MLATTTTDALCVADAPLLKQTPSSLPSCLDLLDTPTASAWSVDNSCLYISSAHTIQRYEPTSNALRNLYTHDAVITHMVARDQEYVVFSAGSKVHVLDSDQISQTFESHKGPINSLSLSNDNTLLASTSSGAVHVHNLTLGSHTVMRGLTNVDISTCAFHPHSRTRLLVAAGKQLMVFDTTRPSGPMKTIVTTGDIVAVACSPFSKTLVAVATSGGFVGLIDLEKEKSLFRTLNVKTTLTTLGFSPEGAAIYLGTETGKILVVDLRALDKPPRPINVSENGSRVQTISIQKKSKNAITKTPVTATTTKKIPGDVPRRATSKSVPSPIRKPSVASSPSTRRVISTTSPSKRTTAETKRILSPKRDPHGNTDGANELAGQLDELAALRRGKPNTTPLRKQHSSLENNARRATSASVSSRKLSTASTSASAPRTRISPEIVITSGSATSASRPSSSASRASRTTTTTATTANSSPAQGRLRAGSVATRQSTTPSPDLPDPHLEPVTPIPEQKQRKKGMDVLGLGTPEVDRWIRAGTEDERKPRGKGTANGKGKTVGFQDEEVDSDDDDAQERNRVLSMQISPRRGAPRAVSSSTSGSTDSWNASPALQNGSLSTADGGTSESPVASGGGAGGGASAHELLRTIVQDVMYDFQRETKAEMMGLHLDLLRLGRGWKTELRTLMDEYVGDLRDLREENQRLRLENERLRRSAY